VIDNCDLKNRKRLLILAWTLGPFLINFLAIALHAALKWPKHSPQGFFMIVLPSAFGLCCWILSVRPKGMEWVSTIAYLIAVVFMMFFMSIVLAILFGAQK
jgi:hypothetical protein